MSLFRLILSLFFVCGLIYILNRQFPYVLEDKDSYFAIIPLVVLLTFFIIRIFSDKVKLKEVAIQVVTWAVVFMVILVGYSYRYDLKNVYHHVLGSIMPSKGEQRQNGSITFRKSINGHFLVDASVNGKVVHFLLDTGASKVTLSRADARKLGFDLTKLVYNIRISTANGINLAAYVRLNEVRVGDIIMKDVGAYVNKSGLDVSLLGMNFLSRLGKYEFRRGEVTFYAR